MSELVKLQDNSVIEYKSGDALASPSRPNTHLPVMTSEYRFLEQMSATKQGDAIVKFMENELYGGVNRSAYETFINHKMTIADGLTDEMKDYIKHMVNTFDYFNNNDCTDDIYKLMYNLQFCSNEDTRVACIITVWGAGKDYKENHTTGRHRILSIGVNYKSDDDDKCKHAEIAALENLDDETFEEGASIDVFTSVFPCKECDAAIRKRFDGCQIFYISYGAHKKSMHNYQGISYVNKPVPPAIHAKKVIEYVMTNGAKTHTGSTDTEPSHIWHMLMHLLKFAVGLVTGKANYWDIEHVLTRASMLLHNQNLINDRK